MEKERARGGFIAAVFVVLHLKDLRDYGWILAVFIYIQDRAYYVPDHSLEKCICYNLEDYKILRLSICKLVYFSFRINRFFTVAESGKIMNAFKIFQASF